MDSAHTFGVLFSSAGRRVELISLFRADAAALGLPLRVVAGDSSPERSAACHVADVSFASPRISDPHFVDRMLDVCVREKIRLVVCLHDGELERYAARRDEFSARGVRVAVSAPETIRIARDKSLTVQTLAAAGLPVPRTTSLPKVLGDPDAWDWPVIAKPRSGSSSIGVQTVADVHELANISGDQSRYIVQERLVGQEYTVNLFIDQSGRLRCAIPHQRLEVRAGEVSKGRTERHAELCAIAHLLAAALPGAEGPLCFQAIVTPAGRVGVFEINARFGGGFPLAHRAGGRFPRWLLEEALGRPCSAHDDWEENVTMLRYDAAVFCPGGAER